MTTIQTVINLARVDLSDGDKVRYPDTTLLSFINNYIQESVSNRPDLFFDVAIPSSTLTLSDTFPMSDRYIRGAADYVIGRANMIGTEDSRLDVGAAYMGLAVKNGGV
jgi:hypothetical protein